MGQARKRIGQRANVPGSELARVLLADSIRGVNWPGSEKAVNQPAAEDEIASTEISVLPMKLLKQSMTHLSQFLVQNKQ